MQSFQGIECLQGVIPWCQEGGQGRISMAQHVYSRSISCATHHMLLWRMQVQSVQSVQPQGGTQSCQRTTVLRRCDSMVPWEVDMDVSAWQNTRRKLFSYLQLYSVFKE